MNTKTTINVQYSLVQRIFEGPSEQIRLDLSSSCMVEEALVGTLGWAIKHFFTRYYFLIDLLSSEATMYS